MLSPERLEDIKARAKEQANYSGPWYRVNPQDTLDLIEAIEELEIVLHHEKPVLCGLCGRNILGWDSFHAPGCSRTELRIIHTEFGWTLTEKTALMTQQDKYKGAQGG